MKRRILLGVTVLLAAAIATANPMQLKRSDVVFMGQSKPEIYDEYMTTVVSWGGRPWGNSEGALKEFHRNAKAMHDRGIKHLPGAAFRTAFAQAIDHDPDGFMDSVCKSLEGKPILVPWLWDHTHKGHGAYWFCTNAPGYRNYLKAQMAGAFDEGAEGLHIDDYAGTAGAHWAGGGCFCRHCVAAFAAHLKQHGDPAVMSALNINDPATFDYGEFLRGRSVTDEQFQSQAGWSPEKLPLSHEFLAFQVKAATEWVAEYRLYWEEVAGHPLALCLNSAVSGPDNLAIAPHVTFFSGEVDHDAKEGKVSATPVWAFKLGDAVDRPVACTAAGWDWAYVNEHNKTGMVRTWIAQAYVFGHQFMPPVHTWCYTKEKGTHWWDPDPKRFSDLTRFVRAKAALLDDYEALTQVGLLYSNVAFRHYHREAMATCSELALANTPFRIVIAGDETIPQRLSAPDLAQLRAVIVTQPTELDAAQQAVLDGVKDRVILWPKDKDRLAVLAPPAITLKGAQNITVVPRVKPGDPAAPFVCHLVNRNYDLEKDAMAIQRDFVIRLRPDLFNETIGAARIHTPGREPVELEMVKTSDALFITVPALELWAIVELVRK